MKDLFLKVVLLIYWLVIGIFFTYGGIVVFHNTATIDKITAIIYFILAVICYVAVLGLLKYWKD